MKAREGFEMPVMPQDGAVSRQEARGNPQQSCNISQVPHTFEVRSFVRHSPVGHRSEKAEAGTEMASHGRYILIP